MSAQAFCKKTLTKQEIHKLDSIIANLHNQTEHEQSEFWQQLKTNGAFWLNFQKIFQQSRDSQTKQSIIPIIGYQLGINWFRLNDDGRQSLLAALRSIVIQYCDKNRRNNKEEKILQKINELFATLCIYELTLEHSLIQTLSPDLITSLSRTENTLKILNNVFKTEYAPLLKQQPLNQQEIKRRKFYIESDLHKIIEIIDQILPQIHKADSETLPYTCFQCIELMTPWISISSLLESRVPEYLIEINESLETQNVFPEGVFIELYACFGSMIKMTGDISQSQQKTVLAIVISGLNHIQRPQKKSAIQQQYTEVFNKIENNPYFGQKMQAIFKFLEVVFFMGVSVLAKMLDEQKKLEEAMREALDYIITSLLIGHLEYKEIGMRIINKVLTTDTLMPYFQQNFVSLCSIYPQVLTKPSDFLIFPKKTKVIDQKSESSYNSMSKTLRLLVQENWQMVRQMILEKFEAKSSSISIQAEELFKLVWIIGALAEFIVEKEEDDLVRQIAEELLKMRKEEYKEETKCALSASLIFLFGENIEVFVKHGSAFKDNYQVILQVLREPENELDLKIMAVNALLKIIPHSRQLLMKSTNNEPSLQKSLISQIYETSHSLKDNALVSKYYTMLGKLAYLEKTRQLIIADLSDGLDFHLAQFFMIVDGCATNKKMYTRENRLKLEYMLNAMSGLIKEIPSIYSLILTDPLNSFLDCAKELYLFYCEEIWLINKKKVEVFEHEKAHMMEIRLKSLGIIMECLEKCGILKEDEAADVLSEVVQPLNPLVFRFAKLPDQEKDSEVIVLYTHILRNTKAAVEANRVAFYLDKLVIGSSSLLTSQKVMPEFRDRSIELIKLCVRQYSEEILLMKKQIKYGLIEICVSFCRSRKEEDIKRGLEILREMIFWVNKCQDQRTNFYIHSLSTINQSILQSMFSHAKHTLNLTLEVFYIFFCGAKHDEFTCEKLVKEMNQTIGKILHNATEKAIDEFVSRLLETGMYSEYIDCFVKFLKEYQVYTPYQIMKNSILIKQIEENDDEEDQDDEEDDEEDDDDQNEADEQKRKSSESDDD